jgi:6-phosphogluconolactonase
MASQRSPADLRVFPNPELVAQAACTEVMKLARQAVATRGVFRLTLAGGSTPKRLYELLAVSGGAPEAAIPWAATQIFFGDERFVAADHADSNFGMAREALLARVPLPPAAVYRVPTELLDPGACAARYEADLRRAFGGGRPRFDLILLGMGTDGHTASLFPGSSALEETDKLVAATWVDKLHAHRITFTLPLVNQALAVFFLVAGADKAKSLAKVWSTSADTAPLPAGRVCPEAGRLTWFVDDAAANLLPARGSGLNGL